MKEKTCSKCKKEKDLSEFGKNKSMKDGLQYWCKECRSYNFKNNKNINKKLKEKYPELGVTHKKCGKCKKIKQFSEFNKNKNHSFGLSNYCKKCNKIESDLYYKENKDKINKINRENYNLDKQQESYKKWYSKKENKEKVKNYKQENKEYYNNYMKEYRIENKEKLKALWKKYNEEHKEEKSIRNKVYCSKNKEKIKIYRRSYIYNKRKNNMGFKIQCCISRRIHHALKGRNKSTSTLQLLGCNIDFYKRYLERRFRDGMTWDNYGTVWHIDHIMACKHFDLTDEEQQRICFNYTNTQPLFVKENLEKGAKLDWKIEEKI